MGFGKEDFVVNHITGERKQITEIDLSREFGKKPGKLPKKIKLSNTALKNKESLERQNKLTIEGILCMPVPPNAIKEPYDIYLALDTVNNKYVWNEEKVKSLSGDILGDLANLAHKRLDSNLEAYYIDCNGNCTDYKGDKYEPINPNFNL